MQHFSVLQTLWLRNVFIAVFVIGCLVVPDPKLTQPSLEIFSKPILVPNYDYFYQRWRYSNIPRLHLSSGIDITGLAWWAKDTVANSMDLAIFLPYVSSNFLIAFGALTWLFVRLRAVLRTPVDDLIKILGLEVPVSPTASLLDITSDGVTVHWKPAEPRSSVVKYAVRINGITVGEVSHQDSAVSISGLVSGRCYAIRIVAINSSNFQASSDAIRVKVMEHDGEDQSSAGPKVKVSDSDQENPLGALSSHPAPTITACKAFPEAITTPTAPAMARDHSSSYTQTKRASFGRRGSPAMPSTGQLNPRDRNKEAETIQALNAKLDAIRSQIQEQEKQDEEEEAEFQRGQASLLEQRDDLKKQLRERDEESKELNKSVKSLEHANSAAQNKKLQQERALNEKLRAREKMQEDMAKWEEEIPLLDQESASLRNQKEELLESAERAVEEIKEEQKPDLHALNVIEEQIQERGKEMQGLDREKKRLEESAEFFEASDRNQEFAAEEREWTDRIANLQAQLQNTMTACWQAQSIYHQTQQRVEMLNSLRSGHVNDQFGAMPMEQPMPLSDTSQHQNSTMRVNFELPENRPISMSSHNRNGTGSSTSYRTSSPFLTSGAPISLPNRQTNSPAQQIRDLESLTGGALISPSAGNLLPSDLLGDDNDELREPQRREIPQRAERGPRSRPNSTVSRPLSGSFAKGPDFSSNDPDYLPGLGTLPGLGITENTRNDPPTSNSPISPAASFGSASQSAFSSPHSSLANLHSQKASEINTESDRRSIRSASGSSRNVAAPRRFDFFSRQRGKTTSDDGPALGSLKSTQSQSVPRDSDTDGQDSGVFRAPQRITGGLFGQMSSAVLGRRAVHSSAAEENSGTYTSTGGITTQMNPWTRSIAGRRASASRPGSTYSTDNALPAPSIDSPRFGWGVSRESLHRSGNVHTAAGRPNPWSPLPSRRPSINQDTSNASIREIGDAEDDNGPAADSNTSPPPAPIGTKPRKGKDLDSAQQLNPNARDFTSMFGFGRKADKAEKDTVKLKKKTKSPRVDESGSLMASDSSPPESRKSRETPLSSRTGSFEYLAAEEQNDSSNSTPQESSTQSGTGGRDTFMRMLTRKSSAGKFSLPSRKDKNSLFSRKANQVDDTEDESGSSAKLGRSAESITSYPLGTPDKRSSGFSLPSFKKKSKKGGEAPSISETSMTSGTGDEEEGRPSIEEEGESTFL